MLTITKLLHLAAYPCLSTIRLDTDTLWMNALDVGQGDLRSGP